MTHYSEEKIDTHMYIYGYSILHCIQNVSMEGLNWKMMKTANSGQDMAFLIAWFHFLDNSLCIHPLLTETMPNPPPPPFPSNMFLKIHDA